MTDVEEERERCARIAEEQPLAADTVTGVRQSWVKAEIARQIRSGRERGWLERHETGVRGVIAVCSITACFFGVGSWIVVNWSVPAVSACDYIADGGWVEVK